MDAIKVTAVLQTTTALAASTLTETIGDHGPIIMLQTVQFILKTTTPIIRSVHEKISCT